MRAPRQAALPTQLWKDPQASPGASRTAQDVRAFLCLCGITRNRPVSTSMTTWQMRYFRECRPWFAPLDAGRAASCCKVKFEWPTLLTAGVPVTSFRAVGQSHAMMPRTPSNGRNEANLELPARLLAVDDAGSKFARFRGRSWGLFISMGCLARSRANLESAALRECRAWGSANLNREHRPPSAFLEGLRCLRCLRHGKTILCSTLQHTATRCNTRRGALGLCWATGFLASSQLHLFLQV